MKKISMKDIAQELNTSITTVSFVINGKSAEMGISPATEKKVRDLIKKRGFNPNSAARMLRTGKSKTIGLIVEDIGNYFFGNIAKIIEVEANKNGYSVFFSSTENNDDTARQLINKMRNSSVDGYIITATQGIREEILKLKKENVPFVLIDRLIPDVETNYVILDNYSGSYNLTRHLIDNGYQKIGFISIFSEMSMMTEREKGFQQAMTDAKLTVPAKSILKVNFSDSEEKIIKTITRYVKANPQLDALFFATNYLGVMGIDALQKCKLTIPTDIAVVSFDDNDLFRLLSPSITVAAQPIKEIAIQSIELLLKVIKKEQKQSMTVGEIIKPEIIIRESSPKIKK
ncbi:MAG: LacI family transcriptional regulator [Chitinophagaceae bacterium]|nr:LacI family DNA-binding transcriptional regulator [Bacteroidota bacterium]TAJ50522.1 MAG: LacI family transcriptional regulator [Chitinophagaceae bacterium]